MFVYENTQALRQQSLNLFITRLNALAETLKNSSGGNNTNHPSLDIKVNDNNN